MTDLLKAFTPTSTLQEMVDAAKHYNAGQMNMIFRNNDDAPIAAVIVVRGEWTKDVLKAIEYVELAHTAEEETEEGDR